MSDEHIGMLLDLAAGVMALVGMLVGVGLGFFVSYATTIKRFNRLEAALGKGPGTRRTRQERSVDPDVRNLIEALDDDNVALRFNTLAMLWDELKADAERQRATVDCILTTMLIEKYRKPKAQG